MINKITPEQLKVRYKKAKIFIVIAFILYFIPAGLLIGIWQILQPLFKMPSHLFRKSLERLPEEAREMLPYYDTYGLRHSVHYLNQLTLAEVLQFNMVELVRFADERTVYHVTLNNKALDKGATPQNTFYENWEEHIKMLYNDSALNATSIGNLAYVSAHSKDTKWAQDCFNQICWLREKLGIRENEQ